MMSGQNEDEVDTQPGADEHIAPVPRVSVQAFCENEQTLAAVTAAGQDRRLAKAHLTAKSGGLAAAVEAYGSMPTPNVIVIESDGTSDILEGLDDLAGVCDPGTRVVVIGTPQDEAPYRELVRRGVNDYILGPIEILDARSAACSRPRRPWSPGALSPSSAPRAVSALPPWRTTWHGRSRAIWRSIRS